MAGTIHLICNETLKLYQWYECGQLPKSKSKTHPLICSAIDQSGLFWCDLPSFGDFCLLSNIMELDVTHLVSP